MHREIKGNRLRTTRFLSTYNLKIVNDALFFSTSKTTGKKCNSLGHPVDSDVRYRSTKGQMDSLTVRILSIIKSRSSI